MGTRVGWNAIADCYGLEITRRRGGGDVVDE